MGYQNHRATPSFRTLDYIEYATGEKELYDISNEPCHTWTPNKGGDPCELNNLIRKDQTPTPEAQNIANQLKAELVLLKKEKGFTPPTPTFTPTPTITPTPIFMITPIPTTTSVPNPTTSIQTR